MTTEKNLPIRADDARYQQARLQLFKTFEEYGVFTGNYCVNCARSSNCSTCQMIAYYVREGRETRKFFWNSMLLRMNIRKKSKDLADELVSCKLFMQKA